MIRHNSLPNLGRALRFLALALPACAILPGAIAADRSRIVVIIGGATLDANRICANSGAHANVAGWIGGGCLAVSGPKNEFGAFGDFSKFSFAAMLPTKVTDASLKAYDTAVLNMAASSMRCSSSTLDPAARAALINFVASGRKLIIYDSECEPGPDFGWFPYPFRTRNPTVSGYTGTLTIVEQNTLASGDRSSPYFIDADDLAHAIDAVGDMNAMESTDPNWKIGMTGIDYRGRMGPVHTYATYPSGVDRGLVIYNGLDQDHQALSRANRNLRKTWFLELLQPFNPSKLPGGVPVAGISLEHGGPETPNTVIVTLRDLAGKPVSNVEVKFTITGANEGAAGACSPANCAADANGLIRFTYNRMNPGVDRILGCFLNTAGTRVCSNPVIATSPLPSGLPPGQ